MRVGALEETITVTGEAPIVDVQSTTRQRVMDAEAITRLPTGRNMFELGILIPGVSMVSQGGTLANHNVGGALGPETRALGAHGGRTEDQRFMMNGVSLSSMIGGGWGGGAIPNATGLQEMVFDTASVSAELPTGGVRINFIAREGGNQYHGTLFGSFANDAFQGNNIGADLLARNPALANPGFIDKNWDFNPGFGGPLKRDKVWFYAERPLPGRLPVRARDVLQREREQPGAVGLRARHEPAGLDREDVARRADAPVVAGVSEEQDRRDLHAAELLRVPRRHHRHGRAGGRPTIAGSRCSASCCSDWTSPVTNKLLIEASGIHRVERWGNMHLQTKGLDLDPQMIGVVEQGGAIPGLRLSGRGRVHGANRRHLQQLVERELPLALPRVVHHRLPRPQGRDERRLRLPREHHLRAEPAVLPVQQRRAQRDRPARAAAHASRTTSTRTSDCSRRTSGRSTA